jgi:hypothetical protein
MNIPALDAESMKFIAVVAHAPAPRAVQPGGIEEECEHVAESE